MPATNVVVSAERLAQRGHVVVKNPPGRVGVPARAGNFVPLGARQPARGTFFPSSGNFVPLGARNPVRGTLFPPQLLVGPARARRERSGVALSAASGADAGGSLRLPIDRVAERGALE